MYNYHGGARGFRLFVLFLLFFAAIALYVLSGRMSAFDESVISFVQGAESDRLTALAKGLSLVGSTKLAIGISLAAMAVLFFFLKHRMELVFFLWVSIGSLLLNKLIKAWFHRERPDIHRIIEEIGYSFPSGHSMAAFSLYGGLAYLLWRHMRNRQERFVLAAFAVAMTAGIGWSRIYLGVHYPSDVIGGYAASGAWLMLSIGLFEAYRSRRSGAGRR